jgi:hypothetical protein
VSNLVVNPAFADEVARGPEIQAQLQQLAEEGLAVAQQLVPVDTGELLDSLHIEDAPDGGKRVVAGTDHWQFPEFGTFDDEAQPYLRPIVDAIGLAR